MRQKGRRHSRPRPLISARRRYIDQVGAQTVRFQDGARVFDLMAAEILGLHERDLPCMTLLLYSGPRTIEELLGALHARRTEVLQTVDRLQLAGYARRRPSDGGVLIELTDHAREWITRLWQPLRVDGARLLDSYPTRQLAAMSGFMVRACELQERHARRLRAWLAAPGSSERKPHLRGGLSPAAIRRVQLFVEANLHLPIRQVDLARRAGLSPYHFARAFRISMGVTPRIFLEGRRVDRAKHLIRNSQQPLAAIAIDCGFGSQSRLTITFKRQTGFTPGRYRRGGEEPS